MGKSREDIIRNKIDQIKEYIYEDRIMIDEWTTLTGVYKGPGKNVPKEKNWKKIKVNDLWTAKDDVVRWFRSRVDIPEHMAGKKIVLDLNFGGEALVYINGKMISSVTSYLQDNPALRTRVVPDDESIKDGSFEILAEAGMNYMEFMKFRKQGHNDIRYVFRYAWLLSEDEKVKDYYFDLITAYEAVKVLRGEYSHNMPRNIMEMFKSYMSQDKYSLGLADRITDVLEESLLCLDFDFGRSRIVENIDEASNVFLKGIDSIPELPAGKMVLTGHSHIDTAWLWPIKETIKKCARTFSNTLALTKEFPFHVFAQSQPQLYEYTKKYYPQLYKGIKESVNSGNWELIGNSWVECDTNIPSGESLVRQILYGREFFMTEFGKFSDIFWMPDVFGYSWALPQIIKRSKMEYFYTAKLNNNDVNRFPHSLFVWQGIDGTRILSYLQRATYNGIINPAFVNELWNNYDEKNIHDEAFGTYGFGDGGAGPTYEMLEYSKRLKKFPGLSRTKIGTAKEFFDNAAADIDKLEVWDDEMYYEFHRGTYTSQANNKKNNRKSELLYRQAEIFSSICRNRLNTRYMAQKLKAGWKKILLNQFHDIIPGSSINEVYRDCEKDYAEIIETGNVVQNKAFMDICGNIDYKYDDVTEAVVVFNSLSWNVSGSVSIKIYDPEDDIVLEDCYGKKIYFDRKDLSDNLTEITFEAEDVPSFGYKTYYILEGMKPEDKIDDCIKVTASGMENDFFKIEIDNKGHITCLFDKENARHVLAPEGRGNMLKLFEDRPGRESSWNIDIEYKKKSWMPDDKVQIEVVERTPLKGVLRIIKEFNKSKIVQDMVIYKSIKRIDFETTVHWYETEKLLKAQFDVDILSQKANYEIAFGNIQRPVHTNTSWDKAKFEVPAHKWADLSEGGYGVSLLNDCKYGYDISYNCMSITLLKSPVYPDPVADKGIHEFVYSLYPHKGDFLSGETVNAGYELNVPLKAVCGSCLSYTRTDDLLPDCQSFVSIKDKNVVIDTFKAAEDGKGLIMRVYESGGKRQKTDICLDLKAKKVFECNLMEENEKELMLHNKTLSFNIKPYEIKTFRIQ